MNYDINFTIKAGAGQITFPIYRVPVSGGVVPLEPSEIENLMVSIDKQVLEASQSGVNVTAAYSDVAEGKHVVVVSGSLNNASFYLLYGVRAEELGVPAEVTAPNAYVSIEPTGEGTIEQQLQALRERMTAAEGDIDDLETAVLGITTNYATKAEMQETLGEILAAIQALPDGQAVSAQVALNTAAIEALQGEVSQLGQKVDDIDEFIDVPHDGKTEQSVSVSTSMSGTTVEMPVEVPANTEFTYGIKDDGNVWGGVYTIGYTFHFEDNTTETVNIWTNQSATATYGKKIVKVSSWITKDLWTGIGTIVYWLDQGGETLTKVINEIVDAKTYTQVKFINIFDKIVFVGDSVTEGHIYDYSFGGAKSVVRKWSYPASIHKLCPSIECVNNGHSGQSVQGYNELFGTDGYCSPVEVVGANLVVVELGWNQSGSYAWPSSQSDFDTAFQNDVKQYGDDYNSYVTTNSVVGNYCQLIKKIQNAIPDVSVICVTSSDWSNLGKALAVGFVEEMAEWLGVQFVSMDDAHVGDDAYNKGSGIGDDVHSTPFGYYRKAEIMIDRVSKCMQDNSNYFRWNLYRQLGWTNS